MASPAPNTQLLIAGGSIAGLTLANLLESAGIDYLVLEKYSKIGPDLGASIGILPNGARILDQFGCWDRVIEKAKGADCFKSLQIRDSRGNLVTSLQDGSDHFNERLGYKPIFVDRKMVIEALYENLKDKSKIITNAGVCRVEQICDGIRVTTKDGTSYGGAILVGADGVHSTVRKEMWRIGNADNPSRFPVKEGDEVPTEYRCIFGISKPNEKLNQQCVINVKGSNHSYLIVSGPEGRIYWFLFAKLQQKVKGLYERIPRYSDKEREELARQHASDHLTEHLCFEDLYKTRTSATLQALPEVVFQTWHHGRIFTLGDAAHKYNPIAGLGGNSAIEDAAVLTNHLLRAMNNGVKQLRDLPTETIARAFAAAQQERRDRTVTLKDASHAMQDIHAQPTPGSVFTEAIMKYLGDDETPISLLSSWMQPAARAEWLPVSARPHVDKWHDERVAKPFKYPGAIRGLAFASAVFLIFSADRIMFSVVPLRHAPTSFLGLAHQKLFTALPLLDNILGTIVPSFADSIGWVDTGHTLQLMYLLLFMAPIFQIWYIEGCRYGNKGTILALPSLFGVLMNLRGIGVIAPLYLLATTFHNTNTIYDSSALYSLPTEKASEILLSILLGYVLPTLAMLSPISPRQYLQTLVAGWQFSVLLVSAILHVTSKANPRHKPDVSANFRKYHEEDALHLYRAYKIMTASCTAIHLVTITCIVLTGNKALLPLRLIMPSINQPEADPTSFESAIFTFLKWDHLFAIIAIYLLGVYTLVSLRASGTMTTQETVATGLKFTRGQVLVGPGAALTNL